MGTFDGSAGPFFYVGDTCERWRHYGNFTRRGASGAVSCLSSVVVRVVGRFGSGDTAGDYVNSGADAYLCAEDACHSCGTRVSWRLDVQLAGAVYDGAVQENS